MLASSLQCNEIVGSLAYMYKGLALLQVVPLSLYVRSLHCLNVPASHFHLFGEKIKAVISFSLLRLKEKKITYRHTVVYYVDDIK